MSKYAEAKRRWRDYQRAHGRCVCCAKPNDGPGPRCSACRARESEHRKAARAKRRAALLAAGLPLCKPGFNNGFGQRPQDIRRPTPEQMAELHRLGGAAIGAGLAKAAKEALMQDVRRLLLDVRSIFTAQQVADLMPIVSEVYDRGVRRGYTRAKDRRRRAEKASEAA